MKIDRVLADLKCQNSVQYRINVFGLIFSFTFIVYFVTLRYKI